MQAPRFAPPRSPRARSGSAALAAALLTLLAASSAPAARPPACPGGVFLIEAAEGPLVPGGAVPDRVRVGDDGLTGIESGCPDVPGKLRAARKGTRLKARWTPKSALCSGLPRKARLAARFDPSCETLSGTFKSKGIRRRFTAARAGIAMDGNVPASVYGEPLGVGRASGAELLAVDSAWADTFAALGTSADAVEIAAAGPRPGSPLDLRVTAWTAGGVDWAALLAGLVAGIGAHPGSGLAAEERTLAGRLLWKVDVPAVPGASPTYYAALGETLVLLASSDEDLVGAVVAELPAGGAGAPAGLPRGALPPPGSTVLFARQLFPVPWPPGPVCVAEPFNLRVWVDLLVFDGVYTIPVPAVVSPSSVLLGELSPVVLVGAAVRFQYRANLFGSGELLTLLVAGTAGGQGVALVGFPVQHCLNGTWRDGDRLLRVEQVGGQVTAHVAEGEICEGEDPGTLVFTGTLGPAEQSFQGSDLKVCAPRVCVDAGLLERDAYVEYDARIDPSGMVVDFEWGSVQYDLVYDDDGNLVGCPENGDVQPRTFPITRVEFGPSVPF